MAGPSSSSSKEFCSKRFSARVTIPCVGDVDLAQGHVSFIKSVLGSDQAVFGSVNDLRLLVERGTERALRGRVGSELQSLAFFQRLDDEVNLTLQVEADYLTFAGVWYKYCCDRFYVNGDSSKGLVPFGKTVARDIFIGKAIQEKNWKKNFRSYPLHAVPCDICAFLTSLVKQSSDTDRSPYRTLDLKDIHVYFRERLSGKRNGLIPSLACPDSDHSDDCVGTESSEDDLPLSTFVKKQDVSKGSKRDGESAEIGEQPSGDGPTVKRLTLALRPEVLDRLKVQEKPGFRITEFKPGEIEWE